MESPRSHELEFGQTFRVAGEGAPGKQKPKLFPIISYIRGQTLKPSASPSNEQRKPGSNQSLENGLCRSRYVATEANILLQEPR